MSRKIERHGCRGKYRASDAVNWNEPLKLECAWKFLSQRLSRKLYENLKVEGVYLAPWHASLTSVSNALFAVSSSQGSFQICVNLHPLVTDADSKTRAQAPRAQAA